MLNENIIGGAWKDVKGGIQKAWGKLTNDELEQTKGDINQIAGMIQKKYGLKQEEARKKLNDFVAGFDKSKAH